jgi:hypothetical protein
MLLSFILLISFQVVLLPAAGGACFSTDASTCWSLLLDLLLLDGLVWHGRGFLLRVGDSF